MRKEKRNIYYGIRHSRTYKPSVVSPFLFDRDEEDNIVGIHSDVYFLLRQKNIEEKIGIQKLRDYITDLQIERKIGTEQLSDDELFKLIEPKSINTITDAYQFSKYLRDKQDDIIAKAKEIQKYKSRFNNTNVE